MTLPYEKGRQVNAKFPGTQGKEKDKERVYKPWRGNGEQDRDRLVESQSTELQRKKEQEGDEPESSGGSGARGRSSTDRAPAALSEAQGRGAEGQNRLPGERRPSVGKERGKGPWKRRRSPRKKCNWGGMVGRGGWGRGGSVELEKGVTPSHKAQAGGIQQAPLEMGWEWRTGHLLHSRGPYCPIRAKWLVLSDPLVQLRTRQEGVKLSPLPQHQFFKKINLSGPRAKGED